MMKDSVDVILKGKTAIITGASRGVGRAVALAMAPFGMKLGLLARASPQLEEAVSEARAKGSNAFPIEVDLQRRELIEREVGEFQKSRVAVDILINSAGIGTRAHWRDTGLERELEIMSVNFTAPVTLMRLLVPGMIERGWGRVVNINSVAGLYTSPFQSAYCASKSALLSYSVALDFELRGSEVRVSTVCPGPIDTAFLEGSNYQCFRKAGDLAEPSGIAGIVLDTIAHPRETVVASPLWKAIAVKVANLHPEFFRGIIERKNAPPK